MKTVVEVRTVTHRYEAGAPALSDISFSAEEGEFVALLGSNGSGKTTLIKTLVGLLTPSAGEVFIDGKPLGAYAKAELYQRIGLVFQNPQDQLFAATVEEDVAFGPRNLGLAESVVEDRVGAALNTMRVAHLRKKAIHHASFGEQKRVAIAGVLAMQPAILLLDEPTAGLDPEGEAMMMQLLSRLHLEHGLTIILATHAVDEVPVYAQRVCLLKSGRVLKSGAPAQIFSDLPLVRQAGLRLPYVGALMNDLRQLDGIPLEQACFTIREARHELCRWLLKPYLDRDTAQTNGNLDLDKHNRLPTEIGRSRQISSD